MKPHIWDAVFNVPPGESKESVPATEWLASSAGSVPATSELQARRAITQATEPPCIRESCAAIVEDSSGRPPQVPIEHIVEINYAWNQSRYLRGYSFVGLGSQPWFLSRV